MSGRIVTLEGHDYQYCPDELPPTADRWQSIMQARFVDELSGLGMTTQISLSTEMSDLYTRMATDGIGGVIGNPFRRFPGLATNSVEIDMSVKAKRFVGRSLSRHLGPFNLGVGSPNDYPEFFESIDLGEIAMHREPSVISGRCAQNSGNSRTSLSAVDVELTGVWYQFPAVNDDPLLVMNVPNLLSLTQGLYKDRSVGIDVVRQRDLIPVLGEEKSLLSAVSVGDSKLKLTNRVNLNIGDLVALENEHAELVEIIQISSVQGASSENQPAIITLEYPVKRRHRAGVAVVKVTAQIPGANNDLDRDAITGDQSIFLNSMTNLGNTSIEIIDGVGVPEYHVAKIFSVQSDTDGYFKLPPISRVAQIQIQASRADLPAPLNLIFSPDYEQAENNIDLIFD